LTCPELLLTAVLSLADDQNLFEAIGNDTVLRLSRQAGRSGFADAASLHRLTGTASRRLLAVGVAPLDLCCKLAQRLSLNTGISLDDCDAVLLCHSHTTNAAAESLAQKLAEKLKLNPAIVHGWNFGCSGFIQLLCEAAQLFAQQASINRVALLNVETPETWHCSADRMFCGIVGAGATAVVVERANSQTTATQIQPQPQTLTQPGPTPRGTRVTALQRVDIPILLPPASPPLFHVEDCDGWTFRGQTCRRPVMRMNAEQVFVSGIELMLATLRQALKQLSPAPAPSRRIVILPHQPSGKLLRALASAVQLEFPGCHLLQNLEQQGNTISCTIPQLLADLPEVLQQNNVAPHPETLYVAIGAGICMHRMHDQMSAGFAVLEACP
jgi:3-oxoacyl-[acyl-carrier-protein] synthase III